MQKKYIAMVIAAATAGLGAQAAKATVITQYSFGSTTPSQSTESATTGSGTGYALGMTNNYTYTNGEGPGSSDGSNIVSTPGTANPSFTEYTWRIVGNSNKKNAGPGQADGWNTAAPNYTQGAAFTADTTGYTPTELDFDWYCTTQGVATLQARYTLDASAGFSNGVANPAINWVNIGPVFTATPNDFYGGAAAPYTNTISLAGLPAGIANDPNFAIELVSVAPTTGDGLYQGASGGDYNNNSGNWRFDNITIQGTPVPEPASAALLSLAGLALLKRRRA
jgi:hypothetical protein